MGSVTEGSGYESSCVVNVNRNVDNRKWNVNTWNRDDNRWNAGNRVLSPETTEFLPDLPCGSFCNQPFSPTTDHATKLVRFFGEERVLLIIERTKLPCDAEQEFQDIRFSHGAGNRRQFLALALIARNEKKFEYLDERRIYLVAERITGTLWKVIPIPVPQLVYCYGMLDNRQNPLGGGLG